MKLSLEALQFTDPMKIVKAGLILVATGTLLFFVGMHFVEMKPATLSWSRWIEHAVNRYQTLLTGLLATWFVARQLSTQRKHHRLERRFTLRKEKAIGENCCDLARTISHQVRSDEMVVTAIKHFLELHTSDLDLETLGTVRALDRLIDPYNDLWMKEAQGILSDGEKHSLFQHGKIIEQLSDKLLYRGYAMITETEWLENSD